MTTLNDGVIPFKCVDEKCFRKTLFNPSYCMMCVHIYVAIYRNGHNCRERHEHCHLFVTICFILFI